MTRKNFTTLKQFTSLGLLAFLVLLPNGVEGFVLCRGEDGHLEIELARQGSCFTCVEADEHDFKGSTMEDSHCGSCVDMALAAAFRLEASRKHFISVPSSWVPAGHASCFSDRLTPRLCFQPPAATSPVLLNLKRVRLLI